jgi:hypothetical protein
VANTVAKEQVPISEAQLRNWKLLEEFQRLLGPRLAQSGEGADRQARLSRYLSLLLFGLINPALKSARSLCAASGLDRMQREVCGEPVRLAGFSEMQPVCDPQLLTGLLQDLGQEAMPVFGDDTLRAQVKELIANDGTLLPALPRMSWALWQNAQHRAGKLHLEFSVWRQVPVEFTVTAANTCERVVWKEKLKPGAFYVNDRGYSHDYRLIQHLQQSGASFVLRLQNNARIERLGPARARSEADRQAGVVEEVRVKLGGGADGPVGRLVRVEAAGHTFLLFTDRDWSMTIVLRRR